LEAHGNRPATLHYHHHHLLRPCPPSLHSLFTVTHNQHRYVPRPQEMQKHAWLWEGQEHGTTASSGLLMHPGLNQVVPNWCRDGLVSGDYGRSYGRGGSFHLHSLEFGFYRVELVFSACTNRCVDLESSSMFFPRNDILGTKGNNNNNPHMSMISSSYKHASKTLSLTLLLVS
jgi:hypothetical protein